MIEITIFFLRGVFGAAIFLGGMFIYLNIRDWRRNRRRFRKQQ